MKIAIAADTADIDSAVSSHGARAGFYFIFDGSGNLDEILENPLASIGHGAGSRVADLLADKGVNTVIAGDFGPRFESGLAEHGITTKRNDGTISRVLREFIE